MHTTTLPTLTHPRYQAGELLGRGAQGVVLRVTDREAPNHPLVAKLWRSDIFDEQALLGEFALLSRLRVPGLVRAVDLARDAASGAPFLVEEYVAGDDAAVWCSADAGDGVARARRLAAVIGDVAATLALLHDAGFVHGDLKPAHVRMTPRDGARPAAQKARAGHAGEVPDEARSRGFPDEARSRGFDDARAIVLDLGAAIVRARAHDAPVAVSPGFAAPELLAGGHPSTASDLFGLGALAWAIAAGVPPPPHGHTPSSSSRSDLLRRDAPWLPPTAADLIAALVAEHPRDRPADARAVLEALGVAAQGHAWQLGQPPAPIGREASIAQLFHGPPAAVRYLVGPSGMGKSHLARELRTRWLLAGESVRWVGFPCEDAALLQRLIAFLRGSDHALPFTGHAGDAPLRVLLDDLHLAPAEVASALDAYRCRAVARGGTPRVQLLATTRSAPDGAKAIELGPLDEAAFAELCGALGVHDRAAVAALARSSDRSPGWVSASLGCVPLTQDTALERVRTLSEAATGLLGYLAIAGGTLGEHACAALLDLPREAKRAGVTPKPIAELCAAALVERRGAAYALAAPALASDLGAALASFERVDRLSGVLLSLPDTPVAALLALAGADPPPARRADLYRRAAARARMEGARSEEMDALFALAADPTERSAELCCRLERLTRDAGVSSAHPQVLDWLDDLAARDPSTRPLALRRRAEARARSGQGEEAQRLAHQALEAAQGAGDSAQEALALATAGAVALFRASFADADRALGEARARLATVEVADVEEVARLDHNAGVVALYRGRVEEAAHAFARSLDTKRRLGDRAGMRACLLNLGLALAKANRLDEAEAALSEALSLARSLGQVAGRGWALAARADVEVRRGAAAAAERWIAEAESLRDALPAAVRADLCILRAQVALLEGDARRAVGAVRALDPEIRHSDALIDARATIAEASAALCELPADRRGAARAAVAAARKARAAGLPEAEAQALAVLATARGRTRPGSLGARPAAAYAAHDMSEVDRLAWRFLAELAAGSPPDEAAGSLCRTLASTHGAERAFLARVDAGGEIARAWGSDLDGLPLAEPAKRIPADLVRAARGRDGPVYMRDVGTAGGRGSRVAAAGPAAQSGDAAVIVLEHRFAPAQFDRLAADELARWTTLAALVLRLDAAPAAAAAATISEPIAARDASLLRAPLAMGHTTALPMPASTRSFPGILGESIALRRALGKLEAAIDHMLPVLVRGETGVGKELFARALHDLGPRARKPFVAVNCGAIPDALFEAELFGHARGSFTGAERSRPGLIARADGGTLLLDEVGELPLLRQAALLRALESRRYRAVGSDEERPFDVRIVAATNRDLERAAREGTFRQDLLYRLNAVEVEVPPLRERGGDVALLVRAFAERSGERVELTPRVLSALDAYAWPGNVRELEHMVQRLAALKLPVVDLEQLPRPLRAALLAADARRVPAPRVAAVAVSGGAAPVAIGRAEPREEIRAALEHTGGNITRAATLLGLTRHGLKKRMTRLGMRGAEQNDEGGSA